MIEAINSQINHDEKQLKIISKKIDTLFLTELLKVMFNNTSFSKDRTIQTYMSIVIPEIAEMMADRELGFGRFLTENSNFLNSFNNNKLELKPDLKKDIEKTQTTPLPKKISLPVKGIISSKFGLRVDPIDGKIKYHKGIDIAVPEGTEVKPVLPGKVIYSGYSSGYGNCIVVEHENGTQTVYAHNSKNLVNVGDIVTENTTIALSGSTGRTTGPHLHFEVRKNGKTIDPLVIINKSVKSPIS
ncbi:MAG: peptidoglycan DD-metalloendopeptidase family protein [Thermodesulfovibrionaceae bacterium]